MPPPAKKVSVANVAQWDRVYCRIRFTPAGLELKVQHVPAQQDFASLISQAEKTIAAAKLSPNVTLANAAHIGRGSNRPKNVSERDLAVLLPLFGGHKIKVSHERVTEFYFYSEDLNWKFYPPGFETHDPAHSDRFQGTQIVNDDYAVRTRFIPKGLQGEWFKYNLWMRTAVIENGQEKGHAIIIIDPVVETEGVRR